MHPSARTGTTSAELARDLAFLHLAEDDRLGELGYHYGNITPRSAHDVDPVDAGTDTLVMTWADAVLVDEDAVRQRVLLSVVGPAARASNGVRRDALERAGESLLTGADRRAPIMAVTVAAPHLQQNVGGRLVTVGFDVVSAR